LQSKRCLEAPEDAVILLKQMTYPSKVDVWIAVLLAAVPVAVTIEAIWLRSLLVGIVVVLILILYGLLIFPISYELGPDALTIRSGFIRTSIPYHEIRHVHHSRSWLSAPALSLDRIEIAYGNSRTTLISPRDRAGFLHDLSAHVPALRIEIIP
jgi:membrane protein YdbS with pleckstrin-like domain